MQNYWPIESKGNRTLGAKKLVFGGIVCKIQSLRKNFKKSQAL